MSPLECYCTILELIVTCELNYGLHHLLRAARSSVMCCSVSPRACVSELPRPFSKFVSKINIMTLCVGQLLPFFPGTLPRCEPEYCKVMECRVGAGEWNYILGMRQFQQCKLVISYRLKSTEEYCRVSSMACPAFLWLGIQDLHRSAVWFLGAG